MASREEEQFTGKGPESLGEALSGASDGDTDHEDPEHALHGEAVDNLVKT